MVLEPLNPRNHPGLFLKGIPQAYQICRAVDSPACKILDDLYHQQITEGNLIPNIDAAWSERVGVDFALIVRADTRDPVRASPASCGGKCMSNVLHMRKFPTRVGHCRAGRRSSPRHRSPRH